MARVALESLPICQRTQHPTRKRKFFYTRERLNIYNFRGRQPKELGVRSEFDNLRQVVTYFVDIDCDTQNNTCAGTIKDQDVCERLATSEREKGGQIYMIDGHK